MHAYIWQQGLSVQPRLREKEILVNTQANLEGITIVASQQPGLATFSNYKELKELLQSVHDAYMAINYAELSPDVAEADLKALRKAKKVLNDARKELEEGYTKPFVVVRDQLDELIGLLKEPEKRIADHVKRLEREAKRTEIDAYAVKRASSLGEHAARITGSHAFFNQKWLNKTCSAKQWRADVDAIVERAADDIASIQAAGGNARQALLARYYETLTMEGAKEFLDDLAADIADDASVQADGDEGPIVYVELGITATERQMRKLMGELELAGFDVEVIKDGMPQPMREIISPDFADYVCFDIEHTGTDGIAEGDADPEITEIGAVKVVGGQVVERFGMLANPGRKVVPRIARLTGITDEMLAGEPPVDEVIARFADFCRGFVLVGHNVKSCDIPHIARAARRAGVAMENEFFDTYQYAKRFKDAQGWESVKLEYLSAQFGLEHEDAHRAWCDAEANVGVFEGLKAL